MMIRCTHITGAAVPYLVAEIKIFLKKMNIRTSGAGCRLKKAPFTSSISVRRIAISRAEVVHQPNANLGGKGPRAE